MKFEVFLYLCIKFTPEEFLFNIHFYIYFSDQLFRTMTDIIVSEGYAAAGYEYINVDDCWLEKTRNSFGQLVPDRQRFSRGMKSLSDYVSYFGTHERFYKLYW